MWTGGAAALVAGSLLLGGCTAESAPTSAASSSTPTTSESATPTAEPVTIYPLTGEPLEEGAELNASIASKIDNQIQARPQVGLQYTDLVYEELVEGGITRYVAVWQSQIPKEYGPVRSIRGMDPAIVSPLGGIITYSGGQPIFVRGIKKTDVVNVSHDDYGGDSTLFHRISTKIAPHNVIASGKNILKKFGDDVEAPAQQFPYSVDAATSTAAVWGTDTSVIKPTFSTTSQPSWKWSEKKGVWLRSQKGVKDVDDKGDQLSAVNVVTIRVTLKTISHTPVSQLVGTGKATVSSGGKTVEGTYTKKSKKGKIRIVDDNGTPIKLAPGNTWIELVATGGSVTYK
jgi:hypothetical protein